MAALTLRALNRTYLRRQGMLARWKCAVEVAVERLVAVQAQVATPPYFGLWSRVAGFRQEQLHELLDRGVVVRTPLLRSTLHLASATDYAWLRPVILPALEKGWAGFFGARKTGIELGPLLREARKLLGAEGMALGELSTQLVEKFPEWNREAMEYGVRTHLPLRMMPPAGYWKSGGSAVYREVTGCDAVGDETKLIERYLRAFGPATVKDAQTWAGRTGLAEGFGKLGTRLRRYEDERGRELWDVADGELEDEGVEAPVRFVAEYDNLVIGHEDRTRVLPEEYRKRVFAGAGRVMPTVLVNGFVAGIWKAETVKKVARLRVEVFGTWTKKVKAEAEREGLELLRFWDAKAVAQEVSFC
jgi:hypothetical protein